MDSFMSPSSSTDALSSASLMMIAQQFFQQQQQISHSDWSSHEQVEVEEEEEEEVEDDVAAYLDGFSPSPTPRILDSPPNNNISSGSNNDWIESLIINTCITDPSAGESSAYHCSSAEDWSMELLHTTNPQVFSSSSALDHLIHLILSCLDDIDSAHSHAASRKLAALKALGSSSGDSVQRTAFYFTAGLECRLRNEGPAAEESEEEDEAAAVGYKTLNDACPYVKFAHLTANQALLEATEGCSKIHIVDYGTMHGVQWAAFLQAMASWSSSEPRSVRITGIPTPYLGSNPVPAMLATKRRLTEFAKLLGVEFEFCPVLQPLEEFRPEEHLRVEPDEAVVLNLVLQLAQLPTPALNTAFSLVERLRPRVVAVAEYEVNTGGMSIREEIASNVRFYCAVFDSMDVAVKRDDRQRMEAERRFMGKEIRRSLARRKECSSWQREEQQRSIIHSAGLWSAPMSHYSVSQARLLLWLYNKSDNFTLVQAPGSLSLGWLGTNIVTVSTWHC